MIHINNTFLNYILNVCNQILNYSVNTSNLVVQTLIIHIYLLKSMLVQVLYLYYTFYIWITTLYLNKVILRDVFMKQNSFRITCYELSITVIAVKLHRTICRNALEQSINML